MSYAPSPSADCAMPDSRWPTSAPWWTRRSANHSGPAALLEKRLLELSRAVEGIREQQRLLARLLAAPGIRTRGKRWNKDAWVALLRQAGFDDAAMKQWHAEFERESPSGHAVFLASLGITPAEVAAIRRWSKLAR